MFSLLCSMGTYIFFSSILWTLVSSTVVLISFGMDILLFYFPFYLERTYYLTICVSTLVVLNIITSLFVSISSFLVFHESFMFSHFVTTLLTQFFFPFIILYYFCHNLIYLFSTHYHPLQHIIQAFTFFHQHLLL